MLNARISKKYIAIAGIIGLILLSLLLRILFVRFESGDFEWFLQHWHSTLAEQGFSAFSERFADYNFPYLYLLYLVSLLGLPDIIAIKSISIFFDIILCLSVWLVVRHYKPKGYSPYVAALIVAWLPTVFLNSSFWGQCDALYTSLIVFSFYFILKRRHLLSWLIWGVALSFKLQAIFFLPVLVYVWFFTKKEQRWYTPLISTLPVVIAPLPAIIAGRSPLSAYGVYVDQAGTYQQLTMNAANWYQWVPNSLFSYFNKSGLIISVAVLGAALLILIINRTNKILPSKDGHLTLLAAFFLLLAPFILPQMHERYFYTAGTFFILASFINPRYIIIAIVSELVSLFSYLPFLFNQQPPLSFEILAIVNLAIVVFVFRDLINHDKKIATSVTARS